MKSNRATPKKRLTWLPFWALPIIVIFAVGTVWLRLAIVRTTYEITQIEKTTRELQLVKQQLDLKYAALRSPRRLELIARSKFGISQPRADQIIHMQPLAPVSQDKRR